MKVSIILVCWNGREHLGTCLDSIASQYLPRDEWEVIMVDNGSSDDSVEFVRVNYPWVKIFLNSQNNYASANNLGIGKAAGEHIVLLNVDTKVEPNWLIECIHTLEKYPQAGAVTSKIYEKAPRLFAVGMRENELLDWEPIGYNEEDDGRYDGVYPIKFINHCSCLYRRKCLEAAGYLDEDFMMYHEDVDMSIRVRRAGWQLMVNTDSIVHHSAHGSIGKRIHLFNYYIDRNRLFVIAKHYPGQFPHYFATGRFYRYCYKDNGSNFLQGDLALLFAKWLKARDYSPNLADELALILRILKEQSHDRIDNLETGINLKNAGLMKAVCQLEFDLKEIRKELGAVKKEGNR